ncbi:Uncharacterised protein [Mycobacteroides abscessus subsp. abscessus]|nr:Uncharacterised protein [Mycobacteroides abscessus subsp. abscessus]
MSSHTVTPIHASRGTQASHVSRLAPFAVMLQPAPVGSVIIW